MYDIPYENIFREKKYLSRNYRYENSEKNLQTDYELAIRRQVYVGGERGRREAKEDYDE